MVVEAATAAPGLPAIYFRASCNGHEVCIGLLASPSKRSRNLSFQRGP
jgi:hypothetical protein